MQLFLPLWSASTSGVSAEYTSQPSHHIQQHGGQVLLASRRGKCPSGGLSLKHSSSFLHIPSLSTGTQLGQGPCLNHEHGTIRQSSHAGETMWQDHTDRERDVGAALTVPGAFCLSVSGRGPSCVAEKPPRRPRDCHVGLHFTSPGFRTQSRASSELLTHKTWRDYE